MSNVFIIVLVIALLAVISVPLLALITYRGSSPHSRSKKEVQEEIDRKRDVSGRKVYGNESSSAKFQMSEWLKKNLEWVRKPGPLKVLGFLFALALIVALFGGMIGGAINTAGDLPVVRLADFVDWTLSHWLAVLVLLGIVGVVVPLFLPEKAGKAVRGFVPVLAVFLFVVLPIIDGINGKTELPEAPIASRR